MSKVGYIEPKNGKGEIPFHKVIIILFNNIFLIQNIFNTIKVQNNNIILGKKRYPEVCANDKNKKNNNIKSNNNSNNCKYNNNDNNYKNSNNHKTCNNYKNNDNNYSQSDKKSRKIKEFFYLYNMKRSFCMNCIHTKNKKYKGNKFIPCMPIPH